MAAVKRTIVIILAAVQAVACFAGSFFVNIAVLNARSDKVVSIARSWGLTAYIVTSGSRIGFSLLCDKKADSQDTAYGVALAKRLSSAASSPVVYTLVHDSDILILHVIRGGRTIFSFNSRPVYFNGLDSAPEITGLAEAAELFGVDAEGLKTVLCRADSDDYVFAEELLADIIGYLELPECIAWSGYGNISADPSMFEQLGPSVTKIQ